MEGEGEVKGDEGMESKKHTKASAHFTHHTCAELNWSCKDQQKWVLFPRFPSPQTDVLYSFYLLETRRLFKHNLFPQAFPWERYPTFAPLVFFPPFSPHSASSLFMYSWMPVLLLITYISGLGLSRAGLSHDALAHASCLSWLRGPQSWNHHLKPAVQVGTNFACHF